MAEIWFSSDWHLFHDNMFKLFRIPCPADCASGVDLGDTGPWCSVCSGDGTIPARPFSSIPEMHDTMIDAHNVRVKPQDHYYNLGDVTMLRGGKIQQRIMQDEVRRFNGHRRLILGNHDHLPVDAYRAVFDKVKAQHQIDNLVFSHYPLHPECIKKGYVNVHGHVHTNPSPLGPYINISIEAIDYAPVSLEWLKQRAKEVLDALEVEHKQQ